MILAKDTFQITMTEKYCARTFCSGNTWFFPMVQLNMANFKISRRLADAEFSLTINIAVMGANITNHKVVGRKRPFVYCHFERSREIPKLLRDTSASVGMTKGRFRLSWPRPGPVLFIFTKISN